MRRLYNNLEVMKMIVFCDIMQLLSDHGYTSYRIRKERLLPEGTVTRLRNGEPVNTTTLDVICRLCQCQPGDLIRWVPDEE